MDINQEIDTAIREGLRDGVKKRLADGYGSPLDKVLAEVLLANGSKFRTLIDECVATAVNDETFRESIRSAVRASLAKTLVQRFGGELEKQINALKSDPTTRARIVLALEEIVKTSPVAG